MTKEELITMIEELDDHKLVNPIKEVLKCIVEDYYIKYEDSKKNMSKEINKITTSQKPIKKKESPKHKVPNKQAVFDVFALNDNPGMTV